MIQCATYEAIFACKSSLVRHIKRKHKGGSFRVQCGSCGKEFESPANLKRHTTASKSCQSPIQDFLNPAEDTHLSYMLDKISPAADPMNTPSFARQITFPGFFHPSNMYSVYNTQSSAYEYLSKLNHITRERGFEYIYFTQSAADASGMLPALGLSCRTPAGSGGSGGSGEVGDGGSGEAIESRVWYIHGMYLAGAGRAAYHSSIVSSLIHASRQFHSRCT